MAVSRLGGLALVSAVILALVLSADEAREGGRHGGLPLRGGQWLQYRVSSDPGGELGVRPRELMLRSDVPARLKPPGFEGEAAFACWDTPMASSGAVWFAFSSFGDDGLPGRLHYDSDADGELADELPVDLAEHEWADRRVVRVKIRFPGDDGPVGLHVELAFYRRTDYNDLDGSRLWLATAGYYEGDVLFGDTAQRIRVIDFNSSGVFNDTSLDYADADRIRIGTGRGARTRAVGEYLTSDDRFYETEISRDGSHIRIVACQEAPVGALDTPYGGRFENDPEARALYEKMIQSMREAETLSYTSEYRLRYPNGHESTCSYTIWLKKPNYARVEGSRDGQVKGILVGDGEYFWTYWPNGRRRRTWEGETVEEHERTRMTSYRKKRSPQGRHSIGHDVGRLEIGMSMTILDPSTFHGYTDSLQPYLDGVRRLGVETVGGRECDVIEVSFMKYQRSWSLWLSRRDHLPRRLKQVVRVSDDLVMHELWSNVTVNSDVADDLFAWQAPEDWQELKDSPRQEKFLAVGAQAPDFDLALIDGGRIKLSDFRGRVVWLNVWRAG